MQKWLQKVRGAAGGLLLGGLAVMAVEASWLDRIRTTVLYRYEMPPETFSPRLDDSGHYVSGETGAPLRVEPMGDLVSAMISVRAVQDDQGIASTGLRSTSAFH
ncbi:MAG: DUF6886 family protein [Gemmatimonadaceae bacterium]